MIKNKDYLYASFLTLLHFLLWYYFAYVKYADVKPENYNYILGMPEWFFYSAFATSVVVIILLIYVCKIIFDNFEEEESVDE